VCGASFPILERIPCFEKPAPQPDDPDAPELTIVIPAWNEEANISRLLADLREVLASLGVRSEVCVVDGGSRDRTREVSGEAGARVILQKGKGFGRALRDGFDAARGRWILTLDADLSHPASFVKSLWAARDRGDLIVASRYVPGAAFEAPWIRRTLSRLLNALFAKTLSLPVRDVSSNFRLYRADALKEVTIEGVHFEALEEILIKVFMSGRRLAEVPLHYGYRGGGRSKARIILFGLRLLATFFRMWRMRSSIDAADYDDRAYDSRIPLQRWWQRRRHRILLGWAEAGGGTVLDAGCGSGRLVQTLPRCVGLDLSLNKLRFLRDKGAAVVQGSLFGLPFKDGSFDVVVCSEVVEHLPDGDDPFRELARVLKPGGTLIVGTPDYGRPWWPLIEGLYARLHPQGYADEHITHYTAASLAAALARRGFEVLESRGILGAELIVRAKRKAT
jgi:dolichol-phosphate mannosyltransferase